MSWLDKIFNKEKKSGKIAKERLMIAIATDRANHISPHMDEMKAEIIKVLEKYIKIEDIDIKKEKKDGLELLEIDVIVDRK